MKDKIYVYNKRYCESGIKEMEIKNIEYTLNVNVNDKEEERYISGIVSEYNVDFNVYDRADHYYGLAHPYTDDDIYEYYNGMIYYVLSFDKDKLHNMWRDDIEYKVKRLEKELDEVKNAMMNDKYIKVSNIKFEDIKGESGLNYIWTAYTGSNDK